MIKKRFYIYAIATLFLSACSGKQQSSDNCVHCPGICDSTAVVNNILQRRSIRAYKDTPVEREKLEMIAKCGINAPSAMNKQPWQVRIVDNPNYINGVTDIYKKNNPEEAANPSFKNVFRNAPAVIFVAGPEDGSGNLDCGLLGENMVLAAQAMGLGTCFLGGPVGFMKSTAEASSFIDQLSIPEGYSLIYAVAVGYPDENPDARPRDESKIKFVE